MPEEYEDQMRRLEAQIAELKRLSERQSAARGGDWLSRINNEFKAHHAEQLAWAIGVLEPRAAQDPELAEVLELLRRWARGGDNGRPGA